MASIQVATAPCSWGVSTASQAADWVGPLQMVEEIVDAGYAGTELGEFGFLPQDPVELSDLLQSHGLALVAGFVHAPLIEVNADRSHLDRVLEVATLVSAVNPSAWLILSDAIGADPRRTAHAGRIEATDAPSDSEWHALIQAAQTLARAARDQCGLRTLLHPHCATFIETPEEVERFLDWTEPDLIGLCLDTGHFAYAGGDPLTALYKHGDRLRHIHLRDMSREVAERARTEELDYFQAVESGLFPALGQGGLDLQDFLMELEGLDYSGWVVVEQKILPGMDSPAQCAKRNREFLLKMGV